MGNLVRQGYRSLHISLFAICLTLASVGQAQETIRFRHLTTEDGLPQSVVSAIGQDNQGFMWMATQSGVARYDGQQFKTFSQPDDNGNNHSIGRDWVWSFATDSQGNYWLATDNGGLCKALVGNQGFDCLRHDPANAASLSSNRVHSIAADPQQHLWIGTGAGLDRLDIGTNSIQRLRLPDNHQLSAVRALAHDGNGVLWVGTDSGQLLQYRPSSNTVADYTDRLQVEQIADIAIGDNGDTWVASSYGGLFRITSTGQIEHFVTNSEPASNSSDRLTSLLYSTSGTLWLGTYSQGLLRFKLSSKTFTRFRHNDSSAKSLADDHIISLYQDHGEVIWVGTFNGVNLWNPEIDNFTTYRQPREAGANANYVTSFAQNQADQLWIGTHNGVSQLNLESGSIAPLELDSDPSARLSDPRIFALEFDQLGGLWVGTMNGGLNYLAPKANQFDKPFGSNTATPITTGITSLLNDSHGDLWVGSINAGLFKINVVEHTATQYLPANSNLPSNSILALFEDSDQQLWIGTNGGGLSRYNSANDAFTTISADTADPNALSSNTIYSIHEDRLGDLWIGTAQDGLNRWQASDRISERTIFQRYSTTQGLPDNTVHAILSEDNGMIWLSTNSGLARLNPYNDQVAQFNAIHGLQNNEFNFAAAYTSSSGKLAFGGINGFNYFDPATITTNPHPPKIALTRFMRGRNDSPLPTPEQPVVRLEHDEVLVTFEFAALDFTAPHKNQYQHRLLGFDNNWSNTTNMRQATYTNLAPGDYRFQVRAANSDGVWSQQRLDIPFSKAPAPWNTLWARSLYAGLVILVLLAVYFNMRQLRQNAAAIRSKNQSLSREIELRRAQELALLAEKQINQQYLDIVEVMILVLNEQGDIVRVNQKGERILGYQHTELLDRNFFELLIPKESQASARDHFFGKENYSYFESPIKTQRGETRTIAWHTTRTPNSLPQEARIITSGMDMTQVRELERRMSEAQKMEALGSLARGIAHDFNNLLSSIMGYTELSLNDLPTTSPVATNLKRLEGSATRARELVESILTFSRQEQSDPENVAIAAVLQESMQLIEPLLTANIELQLEVENPDATVLADPSQLLQLVTNLCTNAQQAMEPDGGLLLVKLDSVRVDDNQHNPAIGMESKLIPGDYVRLVVKDSGHGIPAEIQQRIFDPFFSTKPRDQGTGLGLSVVHGIVRQLGGTIRVDSVPHKGSTFTTLLPVGTGQAPSPSIHSKPALTSLPNGTETILFVDDEQAVAAIAAQLLNRRGYHVITAHNGAQALIELAQAKRVDLLITDYSMPRMTGTELAQLAVAQQPGLPVILISGGSVSGLSAAISLYLQKPYTQSELAEGVRRVIDAQQQNSVENPGIA